MSSDFRAQVAALEEVLGELIKWAGSDMHPLNRKVDHWRRATTVSPLSPGEFFESRDALRQVIHRLPLPGQSR